MPTDTPTWFTSIVSIILALFILFQLKISIVMPITKKNPEILKWETHWREKELVCICLSYYPYNNKTIDYYSNYLIAKYYIFYSNYLINNWLISVQQWLVQLRLKQMIAIHNIKGQTWSLLLISLILK
jgi:hypothetical protein